MSTPPSATTFKLNINEQETHYDQWFRTKVEEAMRNEKPRMSHEVAVARIQAMLKGRRKARTASL